MEIIVPLLFLVLIGVMIWTTVKQNRARKTVNEYQNSLTPGQRVTTGSGMHGVIRRVDERIVDLEIAPEVITTFERRGIVPLPEQLQAMSKNKARPAQQNAEASSAEADAPEEPHREELGAEDDNKNS